MTSPIDLSKYEQLKATGDLPSPKGAALAIIRETRRDDVAMADIARAVKLDPAFVGRLLKAANSVSVGAHRPIASIQDALMVLGIPAVRGLALGFSLLSEHRQGRCQHFDYQRFWSHSLACGVALQALTARLRVAPAEECFSIGLLAHIGELALATLFPRQYAVLLEEAANGLDERFKREQECFVMTHNELSAAMMIDWGLPKIYVDPIFHHERPERAGLVDGSRPYLLTWTLLLAQRIADVCLAPEAERRGLMPSLFLLGSRLLIEVDALVEICNKVAEDWREWGALLEVKTSVLPSFDEISQAPSPPRLMEDGNAQGDDDAAYHMRVLVVDDDAADRELLNTLLTGHGHRVYEAANGRQGLEMALEVQPEIMVVDWLMPEMDGIELTRELRQTKLGRGIYILILTALEDDDHLVSAFESGADDFMVKPLRPRVLAARLRAGQRVVKLQAEIERDREDIRRFAAELAVTNRRLQEAALTDTLTGFPNRRYAMERLDQEWAASVRSKRPLSCMVVDLDEFKPINDRYGHDAGDLMLRQTAQAIKSALRVQDVVARIGGDEFIVICPDTTLSSALACAERIRYAVQVMRVGIDVAQLKGTVSIGVAVQDSDMKNAATLIKRADQGLYLAKDQGRNRVGTLAKPASAG